MRGVSYVPERWANAVTPASDNKHGGRRATAGKAFRCRAFLTFNPCPGEPLDGTDSAHSDACQDLGCWAWAEPR